MAEHKDVWVFCESDEGRLRSHALELVSKGRELAEKLGEQTVAVLIGHNVKGNADALIHQGADKVYVVDAEVFSKYTTDAFTAALSQLAQDHKPGTLLLAANTTGRDLAPRVAARLGVGLSADCTGLEINDGGVLVQTRPAYGGKVLCEIVTSEVRPQMATVRPNVFKPGEPDNSRTGEAEEVSIEVSSDKVRTEVLEHVKEVSEGMICVDEADVVVCSGRGIKDPENLELPTKLAELLGAAVGGSRPIVDLGWLPPTQQVGQSGRTISPRLYFALGISGAIQHTAGMSSSEIIISVNKDPDAPIFEYSDFGIVGDIFDVVPEIIEEIKRVQAER
jgi:electron transfer flavoprotein alpha subunit